MPRRLFIFDEPERFVAGAVGDPGERAFYLQARKGGVLVSVALEKAQVAALASRLSDLLDAVEVDAPRDVPSVSSVAAPATPEIVVLDEPVVEIFKVGAMALAWDSTLERVVIEAQTETDDGDYVDVPDDEPDGPDLLRVRLDGGDARAFVRRAQALVLAGRPPCPFCGQPLEPQGHFCVRSDGQLN